MTTIWQRFGLVVPIEDPDVAPLDDALVSPSEQRYSKGIRIEGGGVVSVEASKRSG
jgi:hypothetical protein